MVASSKSEAKNRQPEPIILRLNSSAQNMGLVILKHPLDMDAIPPVGV